LPHLKPGLFSKEHDSIGIKTILTQFIDKS